MSPLDCIGSILQKALQLAPPKKEILAIEGPNSAESEQKIKDALEAGQPPAGAANGKQEAADLHIADLDKSPKVRFAHESGSTPRQEEMLMGFVLISQIEMPVLKCQGSRTVVSCFQQMRLQNETATPARCGL